MATRYLRDRTNNWDKSPHSVELTSYGKEDTSEWPSGHPMAYVSINAPREDANFFEHANELLVSSSYRVNNKKSRHEPPSELFSHVSPQITHAFSDPRMRHTIPTMIAIGMKSLGAEHDVPMADDALTKYSSKLSKNAAERGLAVANPRNPNMETLDEDSARVSDMERRVAINLPNPKAQGIVGREWVPEHEVAAGREWVRNRLRGPRNLGPQFTPQPEGEQGTLF